MVCPASHAGSLGISWGWGVAISGVSLKARHTRAGKQFNDASTPTWLMNELVVLITKMGRQDRVIPLYCLTFELFDRLDFNREQVKTFAALAGNFSKAMRGARHDRAAILEKENTEGRLGRFALRTGFALIRAGATGICGRTAIATVRVLAARNGFIE